MPRAGYGPRSSAKPGRGAPGLVWAPGGRPRLAFVFTVAGDRITGIELIADAAHLEELAVEVLGG